MTRYKIKSVIIEATHWFKMGDHPAVTYLNGIYYINNEPIEPGDFIIDDNEGGHFVIDKDTFELFYSDIFKKKTIHNCESKSIDLMCDNCNCWKKTREICS